MSDEHVWTYDYANDGNGFFCEWWNILRDGDKIGTVTTSEDDAKMVCTLLNAAERLSAKDTETLRGAIPIPEGGEYIGEVWESIKSAMAYADIREGKKS